MSRHRDLENSTRLLVQAKYPDLNRQWFTTSEPADKRNLAVLRKRPGGVRYRVIRRTVTEFITETL